MASGVNRKPVSSWNPLRCGGTRLPPPLLLMAKLITLCMLLNHFWRGLSEHSLPFFPFFDRMGSPLVFHRVLAVIFLSSALALLLNRTVRASCLVLGGTILVSLLSSRIEFANNRMICGCLLLLTGLSERGQHPWLLRLQVALVYLGGGSNKLFDVDWRSGRFFQEWATYFLRIGTPYAKIASWFPALLASKILSWGTIVSELAIGLGFLVRRFYPIAIWGGILLHSSLLILTNRTFGMFFYAMLASYLAFVDWPQRRPTVLYDGDCGFCTKTRNLFERIDLEGLFDWVPFQTAPDHHGISEGALRQSLHLETQGNISSGFAAFKMMLLLNPVTYFVLAIGLATPWPGMVEVRRWIVVILLAVFSPLFAPLGEAIYRLVATNRHRIPGKQVCEISPAGAVVRPANSKGVETEDSGIIR